jgi:hypothetical protein
MTFKLTSFIAAAFAICASTSASTLVDFKPLPVSPTFPEFVFSRTLGGGVPVFRGAIGATGNADGVLPVPAQTPGGLDAEVPFLIPGVPGSQINAASTEFRDSTLQFTAGLQANAPAIFAGGTFIQQLSPGSFILNSTDPDGGGVLLPQLLLSGNITTATFIVGTGNAGAAFNASGVNYTGGIILPFLVANGFALNNNSMSISMTDIAPPLGIAGDGFLGDFVANATGLFSVNRIPEPNSLALSALAAGALLYRRR